jgi:hypothetical protein
MDTPIYDALQGERVGERLWIRRLVRLIEAWDDRGWAEGIKQIAEVLPDPNDDNEGVASDRQGD